MNLYPNFSEEERGYLKLACVEEIKYWERFGVANLTPTKEGGLKRDPNPPPSYHPAAELMNKVAKESKKVNIPRYKGLLEKLNGNEKEYNEQDIHWLKIMCVEIQPQIMRHYIFKLQADGTVTDKHVLGFLKLMTQRTIENLCKDYDKLAKKLGEMDVIPGEGIKEPQAFTLIRDGSIGSDEIKP